MIITLQKSLHVPGDDELNCAVGLTEGWAGKMDDGTLTATKRIFGWRFYYPSVGIGLEDATAAYCEKLTSVPYKPHFVFINNYVYRMPIFTPFVPINLSSSK